MKPALTAGAFASANDNAPSLWKAITDHSRLLDEERQTELRREHIIRRAQAFTWTVPANDNQAWPLLQSLRKDGNASLVPVAERYRALWEKASLEPLKGTDPEADIFRIVMKPANKADPDGRTKGVLVTSHAAGIRTGGKRSRLQASEKIRDDAGPNPTRPGTARTKTWRGEDIMASWIDANRDLDRLRCALTELQILLTSFVDFVEDPPADQDPALFLRASEVRWSYPPKEVVSFWPNDKHARAVNARLAYLTLATSQHDRMLDREDQRGSVFSWGWRPAMSWMLLFLWSWNGVILPVANATAGTSIVPIPWEHLLGFAGLWLAIYGGGHTIKSVLGR